MNISAIDNNRIDTEYSTARMCTGVASKEIMCISDSMCITKRFQKPSLPQMERYFDESSCVRQLEQFAPKLALKLPTPYC